ADALSERRGIKANPEKRKQLRKLREQVNQDCAELAELTALIGQPVPDDLDADWLLQKAQKLREKEKEFSGTLQPVANLLKSLLLPGNVLEPEVARLVRDSVEILEAWPLRYGDLSDWLLKLASERGAAGGEILRARPVQGEVDHTALSREFIARFPKIRAALAK
ncbi:MAG TPA: hypothetical protein VNF04_07780, partial [Stellaceae bacterium]|nr:hypothetical protein [Stellaceae bacterium]